MHKLPAFPSNRETDCTGMDLRDYFAAQAMRTEEWNFYIGPEATRAALTSAANRCYQIAEAMMKARAA
jgi:hypothetical protein